MEIDKAKLMNAIKSVVLVGSVCVCQRGILGIVTSLPKCGKSRCSKSYKGITLEGKPWTSVRPTFLCRSMKDYLIQQRKEGYAQGIKVAHGMVREMLTSL